MERAATNPHAQAAACSRLALFCQLLFLLAALGSLSPLHAQEVPTGWGTNLNVDPNAQKPVSENPDNTTVIPRTDGTPETPANQTQLKKAKKGDPSFGNLRLSAILSDAGQNISTGLIWRIFKQHTDSRGHPKLVSLRKAQRQIFN